MSFLEEKNSSRVLLEQRLRLLLNQWLGELLSLNTRACGQKREYEWEKTSREVSATWSKSVQKRSGGKLKSTSILGLYHV